MGAPPRSTSTSPRTSASRRGREHRNCRMPGRPASERARPEGDSVSYGRMECEQRLYMGAARAWEEDCAEQRLFAVRNVLRPAQMVYSAINNPVIAECRGAERWQGRNACVSRIKTDDRWSPR